MDLFNAIHISGAVACILSAICSVIIIVHSFFRKNCRIFFKKGTLINRLQIYLAIADLTFGVIHSIDHTYIMITQSAMDTKICQFIAFMVLWAFNSMGMISCIVTFSAFIVVILEKRLRFWKFDMYLWIFGVGLPFVMGVVAISNDWLGFNGAWCGIRTNIIGYAYINIIYSGAIQWMNFILSIITYSSIFVKIIRSSIRIQKMKRDQANGAIMTAESKKMTVKFVFFVLVLFIQWMPLSVYLVFGAIGASIPPVLIVFTVTFSNFGGLSNIIIYLSFRKEKVKPSANETSTVQTK